MSEIKTNDKRGQDRPERPKFHVYPTCRTCIYFEHFVNREGQATDLTVCVYNPPEMKVQIKGVDENGDVDWATWCGWPMVLPGNRCGRHVSREAN